MIVREVLIGDDGITIRHTIPTPTGPDDPSYLLRGSSQNPALRRARERLFLAAQLGQDAGLEERLDQRHDALVRDSGPQPVLNGDVRDFVETRFDIRFENPLVGVGREHVYLGDRVVRSASGPKPVGAGFEISLEDRLEHRLES